MKQKIYRFIVDFEKEEKWLNEMAAKGLNFVDFSFPGRYLFEEGTPGEYIYRLEFLDHLARHPESKAYIEFMESTGAECVATYFRWVWFRKKASDGAFNLFSDYASKIKHYKRAAGFIGAIGILNLLVGVWNLGYGILVTGSHYDVYANAYIAPISLIIGVLCIKAYFSYRKKLKNYKKESQIHE